MTSDDWLEIEREAKRLHARDAGTEMAPDMPTNWDELTHWMMERFRDAARSRMEYLDKTAEPIPEPIHYPLALPTTSPRTFRPGCMCGWRGTTNMTKSKALNRPCPNERETA